jgi:uncharacterized protein YndB with AHSA1/START domain
MAETATSHTAVVTLPSDTEIEITRAFDAPRHLVFRAYTTPELIKRWWVGERGEAVSAEVDLRVGGAWRYVMIANAGFEVAFHGEYLEVVENERLVSTEVFEGAPDAEAVSTVTFDETDGRTTVTIVVRHSTKANRDLHVDSGMEGGLQEALDKLELLAISLG